MADRNTDSGQKEDGVVGGDVVMLGGDHILIWGRNQNNPKIFPREKKRKDFNQRIV